VYRYAKVVLLDGPTGKIPMLAMDAPAALAAAAAAAAARQHQGQLLAGSGLGTVTLVVGAVQAARSCPISA
jgi:hypothetical protein